MQSNLFKKIPKPTCSDEFTELSCGLFIYSHRNLCSSQKLYLITWFIFLMLEVLPNYTTIKRNLSNRNEDKTSNQRLILHPQTLRGGASRNQFTSVYPGTSGTKLPSLSLSSAAHVAFCAQLPDGSPPTASLLSSQPGGRGCEEVR